MAILIPWAVITVVLTVWVLVDQYRCDCEKCREMWGE